MEKEYFISGYCRTADESRMVCVFMQDSAQPEIDCCYNVCPYTENCTIAQKIRELTEN